jgi:hypothetical protein
MVWTGLDCTGLHWTDLDFNMSLDLGLSKNNTINNQATSTTAHT